MYNITKYNKETKIAVYRINESEFGTVKVPKHIARLIDTPRHPLGSWRYDADNKEVYFDLEHTWTNINDKRMDELVGIVNTLSSTIVSLKERINSLEKEIDILKEGSEI